MARDPIVAAGAVVVRGTPEEPEVALIHRPKYDDWSLPKGKLDKEEHVVACAVREVHEETGLRVALRRPLPSREYSFGGRPKVVHYWRAAVLSDDGFQPGDETDQLAWLSPDAAKGQLSHPLDAALVVDALAEPDTTPFIVLRHAKATKRAQWDGTDDDRPLDPTGVAQADALASVLAAYGVGRIHTSNARRCSQTVQPYAERAGLAVIHEPGISEAGFDEDPEGGLGRIAGLMAQAGRSGVPAVVCSHRPVLPALLAHLLDGSGVVGPTDPLPVGGMVVLHVSGGQISAVETHLL